MRSLVNPDVDLGPPRRLPANTALRSNARRGCSGRLHSANPGDCPNVEFHARRPPIV